MKTNTGPGQNYNFSNASKLINVNACNKIALPTDPLSTNTSVTLAAIKVMAEDIKLTFCSLLTVWFARTRSWLRFLTRLFDF